MLIPSSPSPPLAEEILIKNASGGDLESFNQLVLNYQDIAYNHAWAILRDPDTAADAAQESFIKAFQSLGDFRGGSFRGWLLRIVTNSAYDILRRSRRRPTQPLYPENGDGEEIDSPSWIADPSTSVHDMVEQKEFAKDIYRVVDELPERYRSVINLIDLYEFDYTEAARILNVPLGTIKSRLARARHRMQEKLKKISNSGYELVMGNSACGV